MIKRYRYIGNRAKQFSPNFPVKTITEFLIPHYLSDEKEFSAIKKKHELEDFFRIYSGTDSNSSLRRIIRATSDFTNCNEWDSRIKKILRSFQTVNIHQSTVLETSFSITNLSDITEVGAFTFREINLIKLVKEDNVNEKEKELYKNLIDYANSHRRITISPPTLYREDNNPEGVYNMGIHLGLGYLAWGDTNKTIKQIVEIINKILPPSPDLKPIEYRISTT